MASSRALTCSISALSLSGSRFPGASPSPASYSARLASFSRRFSSSSCLPLTRDSTVPSLMAFSASFFRAAFRCSFQCFSSGLEFLQIFVARAGGVMVPFSTLQARILGSSVFELLVVDVDRSLQVLGPLRVEVNRSCAISGGAPPDLLQLGEFSVDAVGFRLDAGRLRQALQPADLPGRFLGRVSSSGRCRHRRVHHQAACIHGCAIGAHPASEEFFAHVCPTLGELSLMPS